MIWKHFSKSDRMLMIEAEVLSLNFFWPLRKIQGFLSWEQLAFPGLWTRLSLEDSAFDATFLYQMLLIVIFY